MRLFVLAVLMFLLNLSVVMVDTLGIYQFGIATDSQWTDDVENVENQKFDPDISADVSTSFGFGDFVSGFKLFRDTLFRIVNIGSTLKVFGLVDSADCVGCSTLSNFFGFAGFIIYILGISQFISNRSTKGMG